MPDIAERLRGAVTASNGVDLRNGTLLTEAADLIDRLRSPAGGEVKVMAQTEREAWERGVADMQREIERLRSVPARTIAVEEAAAILDLWQSAAEGDGKWPYGQIAQEIRALASSSPSADGEVERLMDDIAEIRDGYRKQRKDALHQLEFHAGRGDMEEAGRFSAEAERVGMALHASNRILELVRNRAALAAPAQGRAITLATFHCSNCGDDFTNTPGSGFAYCPHCQRICQSLARPTPAAKEKS